MSRKDEAGRPKATRRATPCAPDDTPDVRQIGVAEDGCLVLVVPRRRSYTYAPSTFGLTSSEVRAEVARLRREGWSDAEIRARLVNPDRVVDLNGLGVIA